MNDAKIDMTVVICGHKVNCEPLAREVMKRGGMTAAEMRRWIWEHVKDIDGLSDVLNDKRKEGTDVEISGFSPSAGKAKPLTEEEVNPIVDKIIDSLRNRNVLAPCEKCGKYVVPSVVAEHLTNEEIENGS